MPQSSRRLALLAVLAAAALSTLSLPAVAKTPGEVEIGQDLREAALRPLNGKPRKLSEFRGKPLIINVWASWCGPCRAEMASLERLAWTATGARLSIIGISTDDDPRAALRWLQASNASLSHFIDQKLELENMLGAATIPLTVLVDAQGRVVEKVYGAKDWDGPDALRMIERALRLTKAGGAR